MSVQTGQPSLPPATPRTTVHFGPAETLPQCSRCDPNPPEHLWLTSHALHWMHASRTGAKVRCSNWRIFQAVFFERAPPHVRHMATAAPPLMAIPPWLTPHHPQFRPLKRTFHALYIHKTTDSPVMATCYHGKNGDGSFTVKRSSIAAYSSSNNSAPDSRSNHGYWPPAATETIANAAILRWMKITP